jgi:hypothetical protein
MNNYSTHIEKNEISAMPTVAFDGRIITIDTVEATDKAVKALSGEAVIGLDTETRPSFKKGVHHEVSLIQLSTADTCFLIRLNVGCNVVCGVCVGQRGEHVKVFSLFRSLYTATL